LPPRGLRWGRIIGQPPSIGSSRPWPGGCRIRALRHRVQPTRGPLVPAQPPTSISEVSVACLPPPLREARGSVVTRSQALHGPDLIILGSAPRVHVVMLEPPMHGAAGLMPSSCALVAIRSKPPVSIGVPQPPCSMSPSSICSEPEVEVDWLML
jgi:hypothetical protein